MNITYFGHSTFLVETSTKILFDPWFEGNPAFTAGQKIPEEVDIIALSHGHSDHTGSAVSIMQQENTILCATFELATLLVKDGVDKERVQFLNKGGSIQIGDNRIRLTHAFHSNSYTSKEGLTSYAGEACGVIIEPKDGRNIYFAGDTALFSDMKLIGERYKPFLTFLPIGDHFTMDSVDAAQAVKFLNSKHVIPMHYGTFPLLEQSADKFRDLCKDSPSEIHVMKPGESFEIIRN
jgi:L-ascorbate metabolism protein UlaG (beta-lactamase superfamily)